MLEDRDTPSGSIAVEPGHSTRGEPVQSPPTTSGDLQIFKNWIAASVTPPAFEQDMLSAIARCGPEDIPAMLDIVRDAELRCLAEVSSLNRRRRAERAGTDSPAGTRLSLIVHSEFSSRWSQRLEWLRDVRGYLQEELRREGAVA
jgi:hypothetical protein